MAFKFKTKNYDPEKAAKGSSELPDAGSIVLVEVVGEPDGQEWAGTKERTSKSRNQMLQLHLVVCEGQTGEGCWMFDYLVYGNEYTEQRLGALFDALGFDMGVEGYVVNPSSLIGRKGYVRVKHETFNDKVSAKPAYWIVPGQYDKLGLEAIVQGDHPRVDPVHEAGAEQGEGGEDLPF